MTEATDEWAGERVARWLRQAEDLERQLEPVAAALFTAARITTGEAILDVGCGTGPTTRRAAKLAGADGAVTGLDVSAEMLGAAASTPVGDGATIDWIVADAVTWTPEPSAYDLVMSRFGVMFFTDPVKAFANLLTATKLAGRLAMVTWARRDESAIFAVPLYAALAALGRDDVGVPDDKDAFSLYDRKSIEAVLGPAGWTDVDVVVHDVPLLLGGGLDADAAAEVAIGVGPTRHVAADLGDDTRRTVLDAIAATLSAHVDERGHVVLGAKVLITTARRSRWRPQS
jgi:SAM-dependent methyltransferase